MLDPAFPPPLPNVDVDQSEEATNRRFWSQIAQNSPARFARRDFVFFILGQNPGNLHRGFALFALRFSIGQHPNCCVVDFKALPWETTF